LNKATLINTENKYRFNEEYESGGAGLFGCASDYVKVLDAIACGGVCPNSHRIMSEKAVMMMTQNHLDDQCLMDFRGNPRKYGYGWGLCGRVHMDPVISLAKSPAGEFGWDGAAGAFVLMDTKNKLSLVIGMHTMECSYAYEKIHTQIRDLLYEAIEEE
jgi:CubicO group peptidase (beta-lactamase class C family)